MYVLLLLLLLLLLPVCVLCFLLWFKVCPAVEGHQGAPEGGGGDSADRRPAESDLLLLRLIVSYLKHTTAILRLGSSTAT